MKQHELICSFCGRPGCTAKGLCATCYQRQRRNGTLLYYKDRKPKPIICEWVSVKDRLPELHDTEFLDEVTGELIRYKESEPLLIWLEKGGFMDIGVYEKSDSVDGFCYQGVPHTVSFWMYLPPAPKEAPHGTKR